MNFIDEAELASLRAAAEGALDNTAVILKPTSTSDGAGGGTVTFTAAGTVAARVAPLSIRGGEGVQAERLTPEIESIVTFPAETDIDHKDQVLCGGKTYAVAFVKSRSQEITRRVGVRVIE